MKFRWHITLLLVMVCFAAVLPALAADAPTPPTPPAKVDVKAVFDTRYQAWREWVAKNPNAQNPIGNKEFNSIVALGAPALPLMIAKMEQSPDEAVMLEYAVQRITFKVFAMDELPKEKVGDEHARAELYIKWWKEGRKSTREQFEKVYADWKALKKDGETPLSNQELVYDNATKTIVRRGDARTPFAVDYDKMRNMGIDVLPLIVEKVQAKDYDLLPLFGELTGGRAQFKGDLEARAKSLLNWWEKNKERVQIPE